jgi:hypothetical protein
MYKCDDCGSRRMYSKIEFSRSSKPRCPNCGCTRLELVSDEGIKEQLDVTEARSVQKNIIDNKTNKS